MKQIREIRIRKRAAMAANEKPLSAPKHETGPKTEQKMRNIVAGWVHERRQRSEELHRNLAAAFRKGLPLPSPAD